MADAVLCEVGYPGDRKAYELYTQKLELSCPSLSPRFSGVMSVHFLAMRMGGRGTQLSFLLPPDLIFSQHLMNEVLWEGHVAMGAHKRQGGH